MNKKLKKRIHEWLRRNQGKVLCQCGCQKPIKLTEQHYKKGKVKPRFLQGHNLRIKSEEGGGKKKSSKKSQWKNLSKEQKQKQLQNLQPFESKEKNPNWQGGRFIDQVGYIHILLPEHPYNVGGYILEHRYIVEEYLKKTNHKSKYLIKIDNDLYLSQEYVVHHINEKKDDNRIENLFVFTPAEHCYWHSSPLSNDEKWKIIEKGRRGK